jgi:hypothetical protein
MGLRLLAQSARGQNREYCHCALSFKSILALGVLECRRGGAGQPPITSEVPHNSRIEKYRGKMREILWWTFLVGIEFFFFPSF